MSKQPNSKSTLRYAADSFKIIHLHATFATFVGRTDRTSVCLKAIICFWCSERFSTFESLACLLTRNLGWREIGWNNDFLALRPLPSRKRGRNSQISWPPKRRGFTVRMHNILPLVTAHSSVAIAAFGTVVAFGYAAPTGDVEASSLEDGIATSIWIVKWKRKRWKRHINRPLPHP